MAVKLAPSPMYLDHSKEQVYIPVVETLLARTLQIQKKTNQQVKFKMDWPMPFVVAKFEENPESLWIQDRLTARWCKNEWPRNVIKNCRPF